jgi:hypothetical protein
MMTLDTVAAVLGAGRGETHHDSSCRSSFRSRPACSQEEVTAHVEEKGSF